MATTQKLTSPSATYALFDHIINISLFRWKDPPGVTEEDLKKDEETEILTKWEGPQYVEIPLPNKEVFQGLRRYAAVRMTEEGNVEYRYYKDSYKAEVDKASAINITCPDGGIKPGISVKYSLVGGEYCYQVVVDIINFHIDVDVRKLCEMEIHMGYRNISMRTIKCDIMTAYQLSPGPDSVTRFQCMAVGSIDILTKAHPITIIFGDREATVAEIVTQAALALHDIGHSGLKEPPFAVLTKFECDAETQNTKLSVPRKKTYSNGAQIMAWLTQVLREAGCYPYISEGELLCLNQTLSEEEMKALNKGSEEEKRRTNEEIERRIAPNVGNALKQETGGGGVVIYELNRVISASIVGGLVNVSAPFVPQFRPGDLFKMRPNYFDGSAFLSERYIPMSLVVGKDSSNRFAVFRIIKMDIEFGTNNGANRMDILALPIAAEGVDLKTGFTLAQAVQVASNKSGSYTEDTKMKENIHKEEKTEDRWYTKLPDHGTKGFDYIVDTSLHPWDSQGLWAIALVVWSKLSISEAAALYDKLGRDWNTFVNAMYDELNIKAWRKNAADGIANPPFMGEKGMRPYYSSYYMWPLIAAYTYVEMQKDLKKTEGRMGYKIDIAYPDTIHNKDVLRIPDISGPGDMDNFTEYADMFMKMGALKKGQGFTSISQSLINIGWYLGGSYNG